MVKYGGIIKKMAGAVLVTPSGRDTPKARFGMYPQYTPKSAARFWLKVDRSGGPNACWNWKTSTSHGGYGQFKVDERNLRAHRVAWELTHGPICNGLFVLHRCDNRRCCNPTHLWLGTHEENMADMQRKGRAASGDNNGSRLHADRLARGDNHPARQRELWSAGERNGEARLNEQQVRDIRQRYADGNTSLRLLGNEYKVSKQQIARIVKHRSWKHIKD